MLLTCSRIRISVCVQGTRVYYVLSHGGDFCQYSYINKSQNVDVIITIYRFEGLVFPLLVQESVGLIKAITSTQRACGH